MYLKFYGLKKEPFHITPDPDFLFLSPSHKEALASIIYGIENKKGFIAIVGAVGVGKTTILRSYLEKIDRDRMKTIYIFNANVSFLSLLKTIYQELGLVADSDDSFLLVNRLQRVLIDEYEQGHSIVLIVDEAQNMPVETLENLRMLSNLETATEKLIQIVMIGQTEFDDLLARHELRQLKQRIAIRTVISPLTPGESVQYIKHRLSRVTDNGEMILTEDAINEIVRSAKGIPRIINILCDNALVTGYGYQKKPVNARIVREILRDFQPPPKEKPFAWRFASAAILLILATVFFWMSPYRPAVIDLFGSQGGRKAVSSGEDLKPVPSLPAKTRPVQKEQKAPDLSPAAGNPLPRESETSTKRQPETGLKTAAGQLSTAGPQYADRGKPEQRVLTVTGEARKTAGQSRSRTEQSREARTSQRIIEKGDTLSKLIREKYGTYDSGLLGWIRQNNPQIRDPNRIMVGDEILFPDGRKVAVK